MTTPAPTRSFHVPAAAVPGLPWEQLHDAPEILTQVLWRDGASLAGLLRLPPGTALSEHVHRSGHHHAYVLEGSCRMDDDELPAGSYAHVPAGRPHRVSALGPDGCLMFYLYIEGRSAG